MASRRDLWPESFRLEDAPPFPCARCGLGHLAVVPDTVHAMRDADSKEYFAEIAREGEADYQRFVFLMKCSNVKCAEIVAVSGDTSNVEKPNNPGEYTTYYAPRTMIPGPSLVEIPEHTPEPVAAALRRSFEVFWGDLGAAANRLRVAGERILDDQRVAKRTKTKAGKLNTLSFSARIDKYAKSHPQHEVFLQALRHIGNVGSHEDDVDRDYLLTGYELVQEGLRELYRKKYRDELERRGKEIARRKGRPRRART